MSNPDTIANPVVDYQAPSTQTRVRQNAGPFGVCPHGRGLPERPAPIRTVRATILRLFIAPDR